MGEIDPLKTQAKSGSSARFCGSLQSGVLGDSNDISFIMKVKLYISFLLLVKGTLGVWWTLLTEFGQVAQSDLKFASF